jgi:mono/diheme cytochrome c family protein
VKNATPAPRQRHERRIRPDRLGGLVGGWRLLALLAALTITSPTVAFADEGDFENELAGRAIYARLCAECHGLNGEGAPGKYDQTLQGDWSLTRLTRVIERTMPEDDPDQCVGDEAALVARYIYDAFFSPESRARRGDARIQLQRLTNRQFIHSVSDLLDVKPRREPRGDPRGLRGTYFNARNFNRNRVAFERVDPFVDFDFRFESPDPELIGADEFAIRWRGSLWARETGEYEIVLRTPIGARLWLNDQDEPLIDASVASAGDEEKVATVRLIGERAYPLRLEVFKSRDPVAHVSLEWKPPHGARHVIPQESLLPIDAEPLFVVSTPFPPDDASAGYERGVSVSARWDEAVTQAALETAAHVAARLDRLAGTRRNAANRRQAVHDFCARLVERAFRRPLTETELRVYVEAQLEAEEELEEGVKRVVLLAIKSPRFLYPNLGAETPDAHDRAALLACALWDSIPDAALLKAAAEGRLETAADVRREAERMIADPRAREKLRHTLYQWLQIGHADGLAKDPEVFPEFTPAIMGDLKTSLDLFLDEVLRAERADWRELLLADHLYVNDRLAEFYGLPTGSGTEFAPAVAEGEPRAGVITHPYLLAALAYPKSTSPIHRGVFLSRRIVGRALRPPPNAIEFKDSDFDPNLSMREKVAELTKSDACQSCHAVINPLGFSLEHFDAVGRFRTLEGARPVDAASDYPTEDGDVMRLTGPVDVARHALESAKAQTAFVAQMFQEVVKQPALAYGSDTLDKLRQSFVESGFNIRALAVEIAAFAAGRGADRPALETAQWKESVTEHAP